MVVSDSIEINQCKYVIKYTFESHSNLTDSFTEMFDTFNTMLISATTKKVYLKFILETYLTNYVKQN